MVLIEDVLSLIFDFVISSIEDITFCSAVCKYWKKISYEVACKKFVTIYSGSMSDIRLLSDVPKINSILYSNIENVFLIYHRNCRELSFDRIEGVISWKHVPKNIFSLTISNCKFEPLDLSQFPFLSKLKVVCDTGSETNFCRVENIQCAENLSSISIRAPTMNIDTRSIFSLPRITYIDLWVRILHVIEVPRTLRYLVIESIIPGIVFPDNTEICEILIHMNRDDAARRVCSQLYFCGAVISHENLSPKTFRCRYKRKLV